MRLNKLLEKQLRKYFPEGLEDGGDLQSFIHAVNESYSSYERDIELSERAFRISEEEYREINKQLKQEVELKKASIQKLHETIAGMGGAGMGGRNEEDELLRVVSYLNEQISNRRQAEEQLEEQKKFYERILNEIPADIAIVDNSYRYRFVNPNAIRNPEIRNWIVGKTDEEYRLYRNKPLEESERRKRYFDEVVRARERREWEEKIIAPDGVVQYHLRILNPVFDKDGNFDIMIIYGFDITERRLIEEQVKLSESRYRSIFDNSQAIICTHDMDGRIIEINKTAINLLGYSYEELVGSQLSAIIPEEKRADFDNVYMRDISRYGKSGGIMVVMSKEGRKLYLIYQNFRVDNEGERSFVTAFAQDITLRIEAERALKKSEEKYRGIIENMNLGLIEVDNTETIIYANHSFCEMSGYESDELIGRSAPSIFLKGDNQEVAVETNHRRRQGQSDAYEVKVKNKRGELKWWLISGAPVIESDGSFAGSIGIHLDITRQKNLEDELRKAKSDAEYSAHAKELFLANMSHEIRTPMNAILGIGRLMSKTTLSAQQRFYLDTIQNAANNLLVIINDLLDFSKIEAGKIAFEYIGFNLKELLAHAVSVLRHRAEEKGLALRFECEEGVAPVLIGDPYRINQVLLNLLGNSIKFTEQGAVTVSCRLAKDDTQTQRISFKVQDTGIGMGEDFLKHLFDKFTQEDESVTRKFGGTGLGMSITKQLVELMGGNIKVDSRKHEGTVISFDISFPKGYGNDLPEITTAEVDTQILKGKRILLVEDNDMNRLLARTVLAQYGAEVLEANDGSAAIARLEQESYDLILMDVQMPVKDGLETTRHIRSHIDTSVPIIALTANAFKQEEEKCLQAGMNDFISKPFEEDKMVQLVAQWLGKGRVMAVTEKTSGNEPDAKAVTYDLSKLHTIARGDEEFIRKMLELFIREIPKTIGQMQEAFQAGDMKTLGALAHRIKPSMDTVGIASVKNDILFLEAINTSEVKDKFLINSRLDAVVETVGLVVQRLKEELEAGG